MDDITGVDYIHSRKVCENIKIKNLGECYDLYFQSAALLFADVFNNFGNMCHKKYDLDPKRFFSTPGLAWQAALKKRLKLDALTDIDILLMVEKGIRGEICHALYQYVKDKKILIKIKKASYLNYWVVNNLYGWTISQKLPVNGFKCVEEKFQFSEDFIESYNEKSDEGYFLEVDVQYTEKLHELHED